MFWLLSVAHAQTLVGLDFRPLSRADLVWVEDQTSGTLVGNFDGLVHPALSPHLATVRGPATWVFTLGMARTGTIAWTGEERRKVTALGVRPAVDLQYELVPLQPGQAGAWVGGGIAGVIPFARDISTSYGEEEAAEAQGSARSTMARIGGYGARIGGGADLLVAENLSIGVNAHLNGWRTQSVQEDGAVFSTLMWADAALRAQIRF